MLLFLIPYFLFLIFGKLFFSTSIPGKKQFSCKITNRSCYSWALCLQLQNFRHPLGCKRFGKCVFFLFFVILRITFIFNSISPSWWNWRKFFTSMYSRPSHQLFAEDWCQIGITPTVITCSFPCLSTLPLINKTNSVCPNTLIRGSFPIDASFAKWRCTNSQYLLSL